MIMRGIRAIFDFSNFSYIKIIVVVIKKEMNKENETKDEILIDLSLDYTIQLTKKLLVDLIENDGQECQSIFNSQNQPSIRIENYLKRVHNYTNYSSQCLIIAIIYLDRYNMAAPDFSLNWYNVHRTFLACLLLAVKFQDDIYFDNHSFQRGGGIVVTQLQQFELQIFQKLEFSVFVDEQQYKALLSKLHSVYYENNENDEVIVQQ